MDFSKWETVIVEWANCLKFSSTVTCLKDLKNGVFFSSLVALLTQDDTNTTKCFTTTFKFLKQQFPNFNLDYLSNIHFQDLLEADLLVISSLLLYYSCIHDRRDVLTSPLCHKLSQTTQIYIRAFLENMKSQITRDDFFQILKQVINKDVNVKCIRSYGLQAGDSSLMSQSPLQDILQTTPSRLGRLQEKDKEINKLRHEIDLERFEKGDLQNELDLQKERNKKLGQQMTEKTTEIIKLRGEIADLESNSLHQCQDDESRELQRRLRSEIDGLEKYIAQLLVEQDDMYKERESIKCKLKKVENQSMIWHDKAIATENNFGSLLEKHQQQEQELQTLRSQCIELSALLEELRAVKQCNESSIEVDASVIEGGFEGGPSCEDLACAVVEVQLRDVQKENGELKSLLKESQESSKKLNEKLHAVRTGLAELQADYEVIRSDNNNLLEKVNMQTIVDSVGQVFSRRSLRWDMGYVYPGLMMRVAPSVSPGGTLEFVMDPHREALSQHTLKEAGTGRLIARQFLLPFLLGFKFNVATLIPIIFGLLALVAKKAVFLSKLGLIISTAIGLGALLFGSKYPPHTSAGGVGGAGGFNPAFGGTYGHAPYRHPDEDYYYQEQFIRGMNDERVFNEVQQQQQAYARENNKSGRNFAWNEAEKKEKP